MDRGSNKSFGAAEKEDGQNQLMMSLNMGQLIQNPGRPSIEEEKDASGRSKERGSLGRGGNIFAAKVRKTADSGQKMPAHQQQQISSGGQSEDEESEDSEEEHNFDLREEITFEKICLNMLNSQNWDGLEVICKKHLKKNHTSSWKAFFYFGIARYKQGDYVLAIAAFENSERIYEDDAQLHYNLGLAYFKVGNYSHTLEHLKKCILLDNKHPFAYNNLAFVFNIHMIYKETLNVCRQAKEFNRSNHNTHMHWAFAEFKEGNVVKAIKKIRKGVQK